jgi:ABC-type oligopeptide transport system substrate-binding subunit
MVDREQAVPPSTDNKWQGSNTTRWRNEEYDKLFSAAQGELDPVKRAALFIKTDDMVVDDVTVIPIVNRLWVAAMSNKLRATQRLLELERLVPRDMTASRWHRSWTAISSGAC